MKTNGTKHRRNRSITCPHLHMLRLEYLEDRRLLAGDLVFAPAEAYSAGYSPWDVAASDLNGDGNLDLAIANWAAPPASVGGVSVLMGEGDGSFKRAVRYRNDRVIRLAGSIVASDINHDDHVDLIVTSVNLDSIVVLLNNGDGTFPSDDPISYKLRLKPGPIAAADVNQDGHIDVVVTGANRVELLEGNGDGTFDSPKVIGRGNGALSPQVADFNNDDALDIVFANFKDDEVSVLLGNGDSTFEDGGSFSTGRRGRTPEAFAVGDLNQDQNLDLVTANYDSGTVSVLMGNGDGTFQESVTYRANSSPGSVIIADLDLDGDQDVAVLNNATSLSASISVLQNEGDGQLTNPVRLSLARPNEWSVSLISADLDKNGAPDLVATNGGCCNLGPVSVLMNLALPAQELAGDINADGSVDFADFLILSNNFGASDASPTDGDIDGDGDVDFADFLILSNNFGASA